MNKQSYPLMVRVYFLADKSLQRLFRLFRACFIGFWLGILKREILHFVDKVYYDNSEMYCGEEHNRSGLWNWEKKVLNKYFQKCKCLLVAGVGGGREVLALRQLGYDVDGFECNPRLVEYANELLRKEGLIPNIQLAPRDQCPDGTKIYDGLIIGWGTYMLIQGRKQRITFLKRLRTQARVQSPILLSFFPRSGYLRCFKVSATIGNVMRWILRRDAVELGDHLAPEYEHYFTKEEIASELHKAGFKIDFYSTEEYAHAVGIASKNNKPNI